MYVLTAWDGDTETTIKSPDATVIIARATEFASRGLRLSIVRADTGESLAITELLAESEQRQGPEHR